MKRVFHHPPEPVNGKHYWRGLGELNDTPEFRQWLEREFPQGAAELNGDEWSRRDFLKLMGASMALAGIGLTSCRRPEMHLVPFTKGKRAIAPSSTRILERFALPLIISTETVLPSWSGKRIHLHANDCALNWKKLFRVCAGAFTNRS